MDNTIKKLFDTWNEVKKRLEVRSEDVERFYHPGDVWWCSLYENVGFEMNGRGLEYARLATPKKEHKFLIYIGLVDKKPAKAIISQIKVIDTRRLQERIERIPKDKLLRIRKAVKEFL